VSVPFAASLATALFVLVSGSACAGDPRCQEPFTPIFAIQGRGAEAAITGTVTTRGVVVGDFEGASPSLRGFYLQDVAGDGDPGTSDGIFVFHGNEDGVSLGHHVCVTGTAEEFQGQTQVSARAIVHCGRADAPPPVDLVLPLASADALERLEGMRVRLPQTLIVTENRQLGRFGELTLSSSGRLPEPTAIATPGAPAAAVRAANALDRIVLDDESNRQNPDPIRFGRGGAPLRVADPLRAGDAVTGVVGILGFGWGGARSSPNTFRVRPIGALDGALAPFVAGSARPLTPPRVGGTLSIAAVNLLNYFDSFGARACRGGLGGPPLACRGADSAEEFGRQAAKTVALLHGLDADVLGVTELENDGYGADSAIADLRARLTAAHDADAGWVFVDADAGTGQRDALGRDAIKVAMLYRPGVVEPVGAPAVLNTGAFGRFRTASGTAGRNRPALAQTFEERASGERFTLVLV
jgi:predicted extracellular nuclease